MRRQSPCGRGTWVPRLLLGVAFLVARPPLAFAQASRPTNPTELPLRDANFSWDQNLLRASFSFKDVLDPAVRQKLSNGPASTIAMRAYVFRQGDSAPVSVAIQTCVVSYDLWEDVFRVQLTNASGTTVQPVLNMAGVERRCTMPQDFPVTARGSLKAGVPHFLAVLVDVNPVSAEVRAQMQQWMQRPIGAAQVGPGEALFSAIVGLFFRDVGGSDRSLAFRTHPFVP